MSTILRDRIAIARKHYRCDATQEWLRAGYTLHDCENDDQRLAVEAAEADKWSILPGQAYRVVNGVDDGGFFTYRARPGMDSVCTDLGLFDE